MLVMFFMFVGLLQIFIEMPLIMRAIMPMPFIMVFIMHLLIAVTGIWHRCLGQQWHQNHPGFNQSPHLITLCCCRFFCG